MASNLQTVAKPAIGVPSPGSILTLAIAACMLVPACVSAGTVYRWVDENGRVQYGDRPPEQGAQSVKIQKAPPADPGVIHDQQTQEKLLGVYDDEQKERKQRESESSAQAETRRANCAKARQELEDTRNARFLYQSGGDPQNPKILTEEERASATRTAEGTVTKWCGASD